MNKLFSFALVITVVVGSIYFFLKQPVSHLQTLNPIVVSHQNDTPKKSAEILFTGDIMLDRLVAVRARVNGFLPFFENIKSIFEGTDLAIGNLEGSITENVSPAESDYSTMKFTFATSTAQMLKSVGFDGFSQANNHALDYGHEGFASTQKFISDAGLFSFGSPFNDVNISEEVEVNGETLCFFGYHALFQEDTAQVVHEIKTLRSGCDFLTVFSHWGVEYADIENEAQKREGREFIDAGADLVIGAHPHVVEPIEIYKGKAIFYSLGNFIFDQDQPHTNDGLAVRLTLGEDSIKFHLIPIALDRSKLYFPEKEAFQDRMNIIISELPDDLKRTADIDSGFTLLR